MAEEFIPQAVEQNGYGEMATIQDAPVPVYGNGNNAFQKFSSIGVGCFFVLIYLVFIIFFFLMIYRFVRATERIAKKFEDGIVIKKDGDNIQL